MEEDMLSKQIALAVIASGALCVPAIGQTSTAPATGTSAPPASTGNWMTQEKTGEWRASKLKGLNVYNNDNEKIGDVSELIVSRDGKIDAVVIGVGGFLGIGEHDVAVPFNEIKWTEQRRNATTTASTNTGAAGSTAGGTANTAPGSTTGTTASTNAGNRMAASDANRTYPDHGVLNMTKDQLKAAPEFKYNR